MMALDLNRRKFADWLETQAPGRRFFNTPHGNPVARYIQESMIPSREDSKFNGGLVLIVGTEARVAETTYSVPEWVGDYFDYLPDSFYGKRGVMARSARRVLGSYNTHARCCGEGPHKGHLGLYVNPQYVLSHQLKDRGWGGRVWLCTSCYRDHDENSDIVPLRIYMGESN